MGRPSPRPESTQLVLFAHTTCRKLPRAALYIFKFVVFVTISQGRLDLWKVDTMVLIPLFPHTAHHRAEP